MKGGGNERMGRRLQELRLSKGFSQSQLARAADVPAASLKNWEQGRRQPLFGAAWRIARAMGVTLDELAGDAFEPRRKGKTKKQEE